VKKARTGDVWWRRLELALLAVGLALMAVVLAAWLHRVIGEKTALERFEKARSALREPDSAEKSLRESLEAGRADTKLWSPGRVRAFEESLREDPGMPLGVLRIPAIGLAVPILEGTDDLTLNRAVGHIGGTPLPGDDGNVGIAGHRDGFFRGLKDIRPGERIEIETLRGLLSYVVEKTWVVDPRNVAVLDPTAKPSVTLVTCYPFYYVGSAPRRFIVRAVKVGSGG
jgi:sortase A